MATPATARADTHRHRWPAQPVENIDIARIVSGAEFLRRCQSEE